MKLIGKVERYLAKRNSRTFCAYLRKKGVAVGKGVHFNPKTTLIDLTRPSLVTIGNHCYMNRNFTLLTHDWTTKVFLESGRSFVPSSGKVTIGNNVSFGQNVMILKGVTIGDNCFIGAGSIVTRDIPANSVAVGAPCKVVMTLEDFYQKRLNACEGEALAYARSIRERYGREPVPADFWEEFPLFVSGDETDRYPDIPIRRQLGRSYGEYVKNHKAKYASFEAFIQAAYEHENN